MSDRPIQLILLDMIDSVNGILRFVEGFTEEDYYNDEKTQAAVERYLEILGEAANKLPESFYLEHCNIEWHKIISLRNRIIHAYFNVNDTIIRQIIMHFLPPSKTQLETILE